MNKPGIPQGTRDFGPEIVRKRNYIFNTIRSVFELYGFQPLETPAMENLDTLMGKYGDEGDKLIFKILNNGLSDPKNTDKAKTAFENVLSGKNDKNLTERALKYDLTIPFARYVAMNYGQLTFPFKRYQMQPVWRADRPQKGRYREFYQCDADIVGSHSILNEVEFVNIYQEVFTKLKLPSYQLHIKNRKVLKGIMEICQLEKREKQLLIIIDKTDKIGIEGVRKELENENISGTNL
jgi:histidyl-tRNA synthetase